MLYCVRGRIVFRTGSGDADMGPGGRLVLPPHTPHAVTAGADGIRCVEAARQGCCGHGLHTISAGSANAFHADVVA